MPRNDDIREWGAENGFDVTGDRLPPGLRAAYDARASSREVEGDPDIVVERPPAIVKENVVSRVKGMAERARKVPAPRAGKAVRKPRVSVENFISKVWHGVAGLTANWNPPVSRVLEMQAPVAGLLLEDVVKDTVADKLMQPVARAMDGGELAMALMGPPMIVGAITARPDKAGMLVPMLRTSLRSWIKVAGPKLETIQQEEEKFVEQYGERIDQMIDYILEPIMKRDDDQS